MATIGVLPLATSSLVMGTGLFAIVYPFIAPGAVALPVTVLVNAVMALPFALRALAPAVADVQRDFGQLADSLGLRGWSALRIAVLPHVRAPLDFAAGLAAALSMGDLGVIAFFAATGQEMLPLAMFQLRGAYQMEAAACAGVLLLGLSLALFGLCDAGGRAGADA